MRTHILMHESFEAPGAIEDWAQSHNLETSYTRFYQNDKLPENLNSFDYLFVMGGPQSPATTEAECPHFHAKNEIEFIGNAIKADKFILGVCLGAQLIGEALGAKFDHSPNREIGVFDLSLTPEAQNDPVFATFQASFPVGHWHGDMPGLTPTSTVLATSEGCPRQVVKYSSKVYGFQCHFEFTPETIEGMIQNCSSELEEYRSLPYIETAEALRAHNYAPINGKLFSFLDAMLALYNAEQKKVS